MSHFPPDLEPSQLAFPLGVFIKPSLSSLQESFLQIQGMLQAQLPAVRIKSTNAQLSRTVTEINSHLLSIRISHRTINKLVTGCKSPHSQRSVGRSITFQQIIPHRPARVTQALAAEARPCPALPPSAEPHQAGQARPSRKRLLLPGAETPPPPRVSRTLERLHRPGNSPRPATLGGAAETRPTPRQPGPEAYGRPRRSKSGEEHPKGRDSRPGAAGQPPLALGQQLPQPSAPRTCSRIALAGRAGRGGRTPQPGNHSHSRRFPVTTTTDGRRPPTRPHCAGAPPAAPVRRRNRPPARPAFSPPTAAAPPPTEGRGQGRAGLPPGRRGISLAVEALTSAWCADGAARPRPIGVAGGGARCGSGRGPGRAGRGRGPGERARPVTGGAGQ